MSNIPTPTVFNPKQVRQLWDLPTDSSTVTTLCPTFTFPPGGVIAINAQSTITFSSEAVYKPDCTQPASFLSVLINSSSSVEDYRKPFYTAVPPLIFVVAATTILAWCLVLVVIVTPRTLRHVGSNRPSIWSKILSVLGTLFGTVSGPGIGTRPWLQRLAALMVAACLTAVTIDTFRNAESQYASGFMDAQAMRQNVSSGIDIRVIRVVSDLFLWLAQIQTLTRLFPRHKEKLIIKWIGFLLICLDIIFSSLNSFVIDTDERPRDYQDAIPALSYLFQLALNLLYGVWVFYYALTKRKYAFVHMKMPSITIIALVSLVSILVPIVFFIVDIVESDVGAWGDYFRWVGAAAASIVVWEWVERIEMLERDEKKDGILGQEVFDGDEMLDFAHSSGDDSSRHRSRGLMDMAPVLQVSGGFDGLKRRFKHREHLNEKSQRSAVVTFTSLYKRRRKESLGENEKLDDLGRPASAQAAFPPVDRTNAPSADSTVYAVRYYPSGDAALVDPPPDAELPEAIADGEQADDGKGDGQPVSSSRWKSTFERGGQNLLNLKTRAFRKARSSPPVEIKKARALEENRQDSDEKTEAGSKFSQQRWHRKSKAFKAELSEKPPIVIPAPPRGQTWSPATLRHSPLSDFVENNAGESFETRLNDGHTVDMESTQPQATAEPTEAAVSRSTHVQDASGNKADAAAPAVAPAMHDVQQTSSGSATNISDRGRSGAPTDS
ncbi:MAG: pH-response regulator protein palH/rim21 [Chrysothrix sp. TS-e1954]|nr:MAG: pH-response regulator protein palH/rim21 [Chrysothrix sp. TS-e1954]